MQSDPRDIRIAQLEAQLRDVSGRLAAALARVEELERAAARQAAPFRREPRRIVPPEDRKRPGRKPGHPGFYRRAPDHIDEVIDLPLERCPRCGGPVHDVRVVEQVIEEVEPVRPRVVKLRLRRGTCAGCGGRAVDTPHPLRPSSSSSSLARGCAAVQVGPRATALATMLNKVCGLTMRKTVTVMQQLCGLRLTAGGLSQAMDRAADRCRDEHARLVARLREAPAVNVDETGWWVGGPGRWLWCFTTPRDTLYRVDARRASVVTEVLGERFAGVLVSDCLSSYDPVDCRKHKCFAHHLRAIRAARELQEEAGAGPAYLDAWRTLLTTANELWHLRRQDPSPPPRLRLRQYESDRRHLEAWKDRLLDQQPLTGPGDVRVRDRLIKHRAHLLRCLEEPAAEPTNNRAERMLRPAVICRKLSCGNRTDRGRQTWEILASLGVSCLQKGDDFVEWLARRLPHPAAEG